MTLNPQYDTIGRTFVQQYYTFFDDPAQRANVANFYNNLALVRKPLITHMTPAQTNPFVVTTVWKGHTVEDKSLMTFEGQQLFGRTKIIEKIQSLTFQKIAHIITAVDPQPMFDGGILICVLGQLKTDDDPPHSFNQTFVLKPVGDSFYVEHDVFRLAIHHAA